jgi:hypothetical protein
VYRFFIPAFGLTFIMGLFIGGTLSAWTFHPTPHLAVIADETPAPVPVVQIEGIRNGALVGSVTGDVRLIARDRFIPVYHSGSFAIADSKLLTNIIEIRVPPGMKFIASKRGKKYYPVDSASAAGLTPANRIYFPSAAAAEAAGFVR